MKLSKQISLNGRAKIHGNGKSRSIKFLFLWLLGQLSICHMLKSSQGETEYGRRDFEPK
jgi:hypothetical protein